jgi:predicted metalloprotease with PDZ domain
MSFTEMSENIIKEPYAENFYNVYCKGALIGMSLDILIREESQGARSLVSVMKELSLKYGKDKPFEDDSIIDEITEMTYPSVGLFLKNYVEGISPVPYDEIFDKVGLSLSKYNIIKVNEKASDVKVALRNKWLHLKSQ